ncbi:unnamed protein product [Urochloa decumbens]|uniref:DUF6598 domain-containing protein n=1 Tax=Urochloa decumbens TaxID=240449 RepID=A0ABC8XW45_9POAL
MGKVWDCNMYGTKLKKFDGCVVHTTNEGDATALPGDCFSNEPSRDCANFIDIPGDCEYGDNNGVDIDAAALEDHNGGGGEDDATALPEDCERCPEEYDDIFLCTRRAVQVLAIRANFPIITIYGFDWQIERCIYVRPEEEVQEEGMVDLVLVGPRRIFMAYGAFGLDVITGDEGPSIEEGWDLGDNEYFPEEYTQTIWGGPGRKLEITYLVIPNALEINVEVRLKFNDLGSRSRAVCGNIKARAPDYGNKSVHLFSCEQWRKWSVPSGSTSVLPLSPSVIALPYSWQLELHIDVDLTVCDNQEEDKHLKFSLELTHGIRSQEREFDDGQVEVITWHTLSLI